MRSAWRSPLLICIGLAAVAAFGPSAVADAKPVSRSCGLLPGEGAYSYIKTRGVKCRTGKKIANRARRKFCARHNSCLLQGSVPTTHIYRGRVRYRGWSCRLKVGWEFIHVKCSKGRRWLLQESAS